MRLGSPIGDCECECAEGSGIEDDCAHCDDIAPSFMQVDIGSIAVGSICSSGECSAFNGTYMVPFIPDQSFCEWRLTNIGVGTCDEVERLRVRFVDLSGTEYLYVDFEISAATPVVIAQFRIEIDSTPVDCLSFDDDVSPFFTFNSPTYCDLSGATCHVTAIP